MSWEKKRKLSSCDESRKKTKISSTLMQTLSCPITHGLLVEPVLAEDGEIYERKAIEGWLKNHDSSPLNPNMKLKIKNLTPVRTVKRSIEELVKSDAIEKDTLEQWNNQKKEYDLSKAESLYHEGLVMDAANLGYPKAQGNLCQWYFKGQNGMEKNFVKCAQWAKKAAEGGDVKGIYYLALCYWVGVGKMEKYRSKAINLFKKVVDQQYSLEMYSNKEIEVICGRAMSLLGDIYRRGGCELDHDYLRISADWYYKSASAGCNYSMLKIGKLYLSGEGITKDSLSAWHWFLKIKGDDLKLEADFEMGKMMMKGEGVSKNMSKGITLIERSASKGLSSAEITMKLFLSII